MKKIMGELAIVTLASFMFMAALPAIACSGGRYIF